MKEMENTNEKKCPKCKRTNVVYEGHGASFPQFIPLDGIHPKVSKHAYKCLECGYEFYYVGKNP